MSKPILKKTQSNIEKMLVTDNFLDKINNINNNSSNNHRVTISIPNTNGSKPELGKTESLPLNGILKTNLNGDCNNTAPIVNGEIKNITFR